MSRSGRPADHSERSSPHPVTTYNAGPASDLQVQRNGHSFNLFNEYQDVSEGFTTLVGFLQTSNIRSDHLHATYQWYPKHSHPPPQRRVTAADHLISRDTVTYRCSMSAL